MNKLINYILISLSFILPVSCNSTDEIDENGLKDQAPIHAITLSRSECAIIEQENSFAINFFKQACKESGNVFVSPLSMSIPLALIANGACGDTQTEILQTLGFDEDNIFEANQFNAKIINELMLADTNVEMSLANSLWLNTSQYSFNYDFIQNSQINYNAEVFTADFTAGTTSDLINSWSKEKTKGLVDALSIPITPLDVITCVNSVYFKAPWASPFDTKKTSEGVFKNIDKSTSVVRMMRDVEKNGKYLSTNDFDVVTLTYGNGSYNISMLSPKNDATINDVINNLDSEIFHKIISSSAFAKFDISLPKFEIKCNVNGLPILKEMGIKTALSSAADFSGIFENSNGAGITHVEQNSAIAIDEEACQAASSSSILIGFGSATTANIHTISVSIDHPFAIFIYEKSSGIILFTGKVESL